MQMQLFIPNCSLIQCFLPSFRHVLYFSMAYREFSPDEGDRARSLKPGVHQASKLGGGVDHTSQWAVASVVNRSEERIFAKVRQ
jgi:hypothetical protein